MAPVLGHQIFSSEIICALERSLGQLEERLNQINQWPDFKAVLQYIQWSAYVGRTEQPNPYLFLVVVVGS